MDLKDGLYRGPIVSRAMGRKSKDGLSEFIDLILGADQYLDPATGAWEPAGDYGTPIEASYFIRSQGELITQAIQAFAEAAGWNYSPEQFDDSTWVPNKIQVRLKVKKKPDGNGQWLTFTAIAPFDAKSCGGGGKSITDTMNEFCRITGKAQPVLRPTVTPDKLPSTTVYGMPF